MDSLYDLRGWAFQVSEALTVHHHTAFPAQHAAAHCRSAIRWPDRTERRDYGTWSVSHEMRDGAAVWQSG